VRTRVLSPPGKQIAEEYRAEIEALDGEKKTA